MVYETFAKAKGFTPQTVTLNHGALGHWIGNKDAETILVYYHGMENLPNAIGYPRKWKENSDLKDCEISSVNIPSTGGGFGLPASIWLFHVLSDILDELKAAGNDAAIFILTYTLTPHAVYPTQMKQAVEALRYIIRDVGRSPANVFIGGESAGGNLTLAVLSHLSHPHKEIEPLEISEPLAGALVIAPWVSFSEDFPPVKENAHKDILWLPSLTQWSSAYLAGRMGDNYSEALVAPVEWWKDVKAKDVLFVVGGDEIFLSSVECFVNKFRVS
jgi:alpha/beta hydrolase fold